MIVNYILILIVAYSIIGWGHLFKIIFLNERAFSNIDQFLGIFFVSSILIALNFFIPLKFFFSPF